jgi:cytoskeletal protein RodZ
MTCESFLKEELKSIGEKRPATAALLPISSRPASLAFSQEATQPTSQPPPSPPKSTDAETSPLPSLQEQLWNQAYDELDVKDSEYGRILLSWAAAKGHDAVVKLLLDKGAEIEAEDKYGRTPLLLAAAKGHDAVVKLLLDKDAEIEAKDGFYRTPLLWAAENGHDAVAKLLQGS